MHFALPPRKSSSPPPYARASARSAANQRRQQIQYLSYTVLCILTLYLAYHWIFFTRTSHDEGAIREDSSILLVTVIDKTTMSEDYVTMIKANRDDYASRHGYKTFYTDTAAFEPLLGRAPSGWAVIPALRKALSLYPDIDFIWALSPYALITNITCDLYSHIFEPLPKLMLKDIPVVPPDSVIRTFSHLKSSSANLILTQDLENLAHTSLILRNTLTIPQPPNKPKDQWTHYFLDAWFDPLYREYAFQKAENHALEHIVQWHPTILAKLVVIEQRRLNSYNFQYGQDALDAASVPEREHIDSMWHEGDLVVNFKGCKESKQRDCEKEIRGFFERWRQEAERVNGKSMNVQLKVSHADYVPPKKHDQGMSDYELKHVHI